MRTLLTSFLILSFTACGGGGGGEPPRPSLPAPTPQTPEPAQLDQENAGKFARELEDLLREAVNLPDILRAGIPSEFPVGSTTIGCEFGGTVRVQVSSDRLQMASTFTECEVSRDFSRVTLSGTQTDSYLGPAGDNAFVVEISLNNYRRSFPDGHSLVTNGSIRLAAGERTGQVSQDRVLYDLTVRYPEGNTVALDAISVGLQLDRPGATPGLWAVRDLAGRISHSDEGRATIALDDTDREITLSGSGTTIARLALSDSFIRSVTLHPAASAPASAFLMFFARNSVDPAFFDDTLNRPPFVASDHVPGIASPLLLSDETVSFSLRYNFSDPDLDLLTLSVSAAPVELTDRDGVTTVLDTGDPSVPFTLSEDEPGLFTFSALAPEEVTTYNFDVVAIDADGATSRDPLRLSIPVHLDTDGDLVSDLVDRDDDDDGVADNADLFPLDPLESADNDGDGIGDNGDDDDDNDGVADVADAYPLDPICHRQEDGNGDVCTLRLFSDSTRVAIDTGGIAYLADPNTTTLDGAEVYRFDTNTGQFIEPLPLDPSVAGLTPDSIVRQVIFNEHHDALYVLYGADAVTRIALNDPVPNETLVQLRSSSMASLREVLDFGPYIVVEEYEATVYTRFSFDDQGSQVDSRTWPANFGGPPFTRPGNAGFCESGISLNLQNGTFYEYSNPGKRQCAYPQTAPLSSPDGSRALIVDELRIVDQDLLDVGLIVPQGIVADRDRVWSWLPEGIFIGSSLAMEVFDDDGNALTTVQHDGHVYRINSAALRAGDTVYLIHRSSVSGVTIERYTAP